MNRLTTCFLFMATTQMSFAGEEKPSHNECEDNLEPVKITSPELPRLLHNEFEGFAIVKLIVEKSGKVSKPEIISEYWNPIGNSRGKPRGYKKAILTAISSYEYTVREEGCITTSRFKFEFEK